jgi:hypothetical protein
MGRPPNGKDTTAGGRSARRTPPPEATGFEARYLTGLHATGSTVRLHLRDGTVIEGIVLDHDRELMSLTASGDGREIAVRKSEIRYLEELGRG